MDEKNREIKTYQHDNEWYIDEIISIEIGDKRLEERLVEILKSKHESPSKSIPCSMETKAKVKGAYRFLSNEKIKSEELFKAHAESTKKRIGNKRKIILAPQDTTDISYNNTGSRKGLGYINDSEKTKGFFFHPTLALTETGIPLGILDAQIWVREELDRNKGKSKSELKKERLNKSIEDKESKKWLESYRKMCELESEEVHYVSICDREGDIFELFYEYVKQTGENRPDLLVRANKEKQRQIEESGELSGLFEYMERKESYTEYMIEVPRRKEKPGRCARMKIKYSEVEIQAPKNNPYMKDKEGIKLYAIYTEEIESPDKEDAISWLLLTTMPIVSIEDAMEKLEWYLKRWMIEVYFKVLKSGCKIESSQLKEYERLRKILALECIIAWRILFMTMLGRECPELPATVILNEWEWKALHIFINKTKEIPKEVPTLGVVIKQIAKLGGFLGRKRDGNPGVIVLTRGLQDLHIISAFYKQITYG